MKSHPALASARGCGHEVSILIAMSVPVGRCDGVEPRARLSMMIMRPQHGQAGSLRSAAPSAGLVPVPFPVGSENQGEPGRKTAKPSQWVSSG
jgi:hypothetical protein